MKRTMTLLLLTSLALPAFAAKEKFKTMHVGDLAAALKSSQPPKIYDANNKDTREKYGIIPGATLLTSSKKYDTAKVLPADKKTPLVFYCANPMCLSSHQAADKAIAAGHTDVSVMVDGIMGWKDAGQPTSPAAASATPKAKKG